MIRGERLAWSLAGGFATAFFVLVGWMIQPLVDDQLSDYLQFRFGSK